MLGSRVIPEYVASSANFGG